MYYTDYNSNNVYNLNSFNDGSEFKFDIIGFEGGLGVDNPASTLTKIDNNDDLEKATFLNSLNGKTFIGIYVNREAAIGFYNFMCDIVTTLSDLYDLIIPLKSASYLTVGEFLAKTVTKVGEKMVSIIGSVPSVGIGHVIKSILIVLGVALALYAVVCFISGALQLGFTLGFIRNGFMNWNFLYEVDHGI